MCIEWEQRYRPDDSSEWGNWEDGGGEDNTVVLNTSDAGYYQYQVSNDEGDIGFEWGFFNGVNFNGFSGEPIITDLKAVYNASFIVIGYEGNCDIHGIIGVLSSYIWDGEWNPELGRNQYGGEYGTLSFTGNLVIYY